MPLRLVHRILSAVLVASLAISVSDGLLCLIPCAATSASAVDAGGGGHCASKGAEQEVSHSLADPSSDCAGDHAIGAWIGERVAQRASLESQPGEAGGTLPRADASTPAVNAPSRLSISPGPPGTFIPLRI